MDSHFPVRRRENTLGLAALASPRFLLWKRKDPALRSTLPVEGEESGRRRDIHWKIFGRAACPRDRAAAPNAPSAARLQLGAYSLSVWARCVPTLEQLQPQQRWYSSAPDIPMPTRFVHEDMCGKRFLNYIRALVAVFILYFYNWTCMLRLWMTFYMNIIVSLHVNITYMIMDDFLGKNNFSLEDSTAFDCLVLKSYFLEIWTVKFFVQNLYFWLKTNP